MSPRIVAVLAAAVALGACGGESKEDDARAQVCDARADIDRQVDALRGLTASTFTTDAVRGSVTAIRDDLRKIGEAQADLSDERRAEVKAANDALAAELRDIGATVLRSTSAEDARAQLQTATAELGETYRTTLAKVDCG